MYFVLLVLGILLDLSPDVNHKQGGFSKTLPEEGLEFVSSKRDGIVAFNLRFLPLPAKVNLVSKKQGCKKDRFMACSSGRIKMILTLSTKVIAFHMQAPIVKVGVPGLERAIAGCGTCLKLAKFLVFNK